MDNAQKAIMIGVGLFITIIIIAAVMAITGMGQNLLNSGSKQITGISSQMQQQLTAAYDNTTLTGADVVAAVQKYYSDATLGVYLGSTCVSPKGFGSGDAPKPNSTTNTTYYTVKLASDFTTNSQPSFGTFSTIGNANYINPSATYKAYLIKVSTDVVGVQFIKQ